MHNISANKKPKLDNKSNKLNFNYSWVDNSKYTKKQLKDAPIEI